MVEITFEEVMANNRRPGACWLIIHGQVYDVTSFLDGHPGGRDRLLSARGRDATHDFDAVDHPRYVRERLMQRYYRGDVDMNAVPGDRNQDHQPQYMPPEDTTRRIRISELLLILALAAYSGFFLETFVILVIAVACGYLTIEN